MRTIISVKIIAIAIIEAVIPVVLHVLPALPVHKDLPVSAVLLGLKALLAQEVFPEFPVLSGLRVPLVPRVL